MDHLATDQQDDDSGEIDSRVYRLERDAVIAEFHRSEHRREGAVALIFVQLGIVLACALYLATTVDEFRQFLAETNGLFADLALGLIALIMLVNATVGMLRLRGSNRPAKKFVAHADIAE